MDRIEEELGLNRITHLKNLQEVKSLSKQDQVRLHNSDADLNTFYRFAHFVQRHRMNRHSLKVPFLLFRGLSILISYPQVKKVYSRMKRTYQSLYPEGFLTEKKIKRWTYRLMSYFIELFWEIVFCIFNHRVHNYDKYIEVTGLEHVQKTLKKGKGILSPTLHVGEMFHPLSATVRNSYITAEGKKKNIFIVILASPENEYLFRDVVDLYESVDVIITGNFGDVRDLIVAHLSQNHLVYLMQDYSNQSQLRVPFIYGNKFYNFLVPTPQLLSHLHLNENIEAPLVPCMPVPKTEKNLKYSHLKIYPELDIRDISVDDVEDPILREEIKKFQADKLPQKAQYGLVSLLINQRLFPYILKYPFLWEEAIPYLKRSSYKFIPEKTPTYAEVFPSLVDFYKDFIENSYEPGRNDQHIMDTLEDLKQKVQLILENTDLSSQTLPQEIDDLEIGRLTGKESLMKINAYLQEIISTAPSPYPEKLSFLSEKLDELTGYWPNYPHSYKLKKLE